MAEHSKEQTEAERQTKECMAYYAHREQCVNALAGLKPEKVKALVEEVEVMCSGGYYVSGPGNDREFCLECSYPKPGHKFNCGLAALRTALAEVKSDE